MDVFDNDHDHEEPIVRYNSNVNRTILYVSMLSFSTILFLIFLFYFCFRCVFWRRSRHRAAIRRLTLAALHVSDLDAATAHRHAEPPNAGLDPAIIASLPTFAVGAKVLGGGGGTEAECAVCLNALEEEEKAKLLPNCDHFFHVDCIDTWLDSHSTCPLCRGEAKPQLEPEDREGPVGLSLGSAGIGAPVLFNVGVDCSGDNNDNSHDELSKSNGSNSRLSSFRRILSRERSSRRIQPSGHDDEDAGVDPDLERQ